MKYLMVGPLFCCHCGVQLSPVSPTCLRELGPRRGPGSLTLFHPAPPDVPVCVYNGKCFLITVPVQTAVEIDE